MTTNSQSRAGQGCENDHDEEKVTPSPPTGHDGSGLSRDDHDAPGENDANGPVQSLSKRSDLADPPPLPPTPHQTAVSWFVSDVLIYIVVLNLADEIFDSIEIDHFSIGIFVAVVLKLVLWAIQYLEHEIKHFFCVKLERKVAGAFFMWLVVFSSKFLFLWIDDVIFGSHVDLGKFISIMVLSGTLVVMEVASRFLYTKMGDWEQKQQKEREEGRIVDG